jgi:nicotinamidase-related amidase
MPDYTAPERNRVALLTVNGQRDFTLPDSPLAAPGVRCALPQMKRLAEGFRVHGLPIFHAVRLHRCDGSNVDAFRRQAVEEGLRILMPGTSGAELVDELRPSPDLRLNPTGLLEGEVSEIAPNEWVMYKPRWGAFYRTDLERHLRDQNVSTLVICGCNFSTSCRATVYEAGARDFRIVLVTDALSGASDEALSELGRIGVYLMTTASCLDWLDGRSRSTAA